MSTVAGFQYLPTMKSMSLLRFFVLVLLTTPGLAHQYNATADTGNVVAVYPISGTYGLLNRILFYSLWIVVLCFGKWTWPAIGALAYVMTYSATSAVHGLVLAITSRHSLYDLDVAGAWAILSFASVASAPIMWYSRHLRDSSYRPVFGFWSTVVAVGAICCIVALFRDYPEDSACWSEPTQGQPILLTQAVQLLTPDRFNCSYASFKTSQPTRNPVDIIMIDPERAFGRFYTLIIASAIMTVALGIYWGVWGCLFVGDRKRTREELIKATSRKIPKSLSPKARRSAEAAKRRARRELETGEYQQTTNACLFLNPIALPVIVAFNEVYLLAPKALPTNENLYAIGQWGSWVTVGMSLIAAAINTKYGPRWTKLQEIIAAEQKERISRKAKASVPQIKMDLESGSVLPLDKTKVPWHDLVLQEALSKVSPPPEAFPGGGTSESINPPKYSARHTTSHGAADRTLQVYKNQISNGNILRQRNRLDRIKYDPPFQFNSEGIHDLDLMPIVQFNCVCEAYDEVGTEHDGTIVRDSYGHDWLVQRGLLWHRELWENIQEEKSNDTKFFRPS